MPGSPVCTIIALVTCCILFVYGGEVGIFLRLSLYGHSYVIRQREVCGPPPIVFTVLDALCINEDWNFCNLLNAVARLFILVARVAAHQDTRNAAS